MSLKLTTEKCTPEVSEVNFCGIFTGVVYVYGRHQGGDEAARNVRSYIDKILKTEKIKEIDPELAAIEPVEEYSSINAAGESDSSSSDDDDGLSRLGILLIVIASILALAITYYFYIQWSERNLGGTIFSSRQNSKRRQWNRIFKRHQRNQYKDYDPEERSIRSCVEAEEEFEDDYDDYAGNVGHNVDNTRLDFISEGSRSSMSGSDRSGRASARASGLRPSIDGDVTMNVKETASRTTLDNGLDGLRFDYDDDDNRVKSRNSDSIGEFI
jgi:hypothetical protein